MSGPLGCKTEKRASGRRTRGLRHCVYLIHHFRQAVLPAAELIIETEKRSLDSVIRHYATHNDTGLLILVARPVDHPQRLQSSPDNFLGTVGGYVKAYRNRGEILLQVIPETVRVHEVVTS